MKKSKKMKYTDIKLLRKEYAAGNYLESSDYIIGLIYGQD